MKVTVLAKPNSRKESIEVLPDGSLAIKVNAVPEDGEANLRIIEMLSEHFKIPKSRIDILSGHKGKKKIFNIES